MMQIDEIQRLTSQPEWLSYLDTLQEKIDILVKQWRQNGAKDKDMDMYLKGQIEGLEWASSVLSREKDKFYAEQVRNKI